MNKLFALSCIFLFCINLQATTTTEEQVFPKPSSNLEENSIDLEKQFHIDSSAYIKKYLKSKNSSELSRNLTKKYYRNHSYKAFFISNEGIKPIAYSLIDIIKNDQVLKPSINELFNLKKIDSLLSLAIENNDIPSLIKLDFMLISTYHKYMSFLSKGIIDWKSFQEELKLLDEEKEIIANWKKYDVRKNIRKLLYKAVKADDILLAINEVNYTFPKAKELSDLIKEYEEINQNGGYIKIPSAKKSMRKGNYYPQIKDLRKRLVQSNDLDNSECFVEEENIDEKNANNLFIAQEQIKTEKQDIVHVKDCQELYDENVFQAVKSFQKNHGLVEDGIVGKNTIKRLNIAIETKIKKMRINLERMRWMPRNLGKKYLLVNIPDYHLRVYKEGEKKLEMPVVVGLKKHPTPIFSNKVSTVVLNPYWRIPQRIVKREIIPKLVEDPTYLDKNEIKTYENWSHESMQYDTTSVDWSMYLDNDLIGSSEEAPMRFIQIPGERNPLGRMKFLFPNKYSVYLHDTPEKSLFGQKRRAFSHGCIRLAKPHDLLKAIAQEDIKVDYEEAEEILSDIEKTDFDLTKKIPVHIVYLTSWINDEGKIQFRDDIYNYDKMQAKFIYNKPL